MIVLRFVHSSLCLIEYCLIFFPTDTHVIAQRIDKKTRNLPNNKNVLIKSSKKEEEEEKKLNKLIFHFSPIEAKEERKMIE